MINTVRAIDGTLKTETATGPVWHRYNDDGYGEHADGGPFDGTGIGRPWPLLSGERAHYELAAGNIQGAEELLQSVEHSTNGSRLLPEQVWDAADIAGGELFLGKPSGSACPLVWAHSEYIKLVRSLKDGKIFDQPSATVRRYQVEKRAAGIHEWRYNNKCRSIPAGKNLRIALLSPALVHWSKDDWQTTNDVNTRNTGVGIHTADLPADALPLGRTVVFTFYWTGTGQWEGADFSVTISSK
jgi:glucoamylase